MEFETEMRDAELSDADDSLASTVESEPQDEYEVETILFEDEDSGLYLIKWAGYPEHRATWEGPESFKHVVEVMNDWKQAKREIRQGLRDPFDIDKWTKEQERLQRNKERRKRNRRIKRAIRAKKRLESLKRSDRGRPKLFSADSDKEPSDPGDGENTRGVDLPRVLDRPYTHRGRLRLFSDDDDDSGEDEVPFLPRGDANAQEVHAAMDRIPEQVSRTERNERGVSLDLTVEADANAVVQNPASKRPASVLSVSSSDSLFVSQDEAPAVTASTKTSRTSQYEIESHAIELDREAERQLSRSSPRRTRSRSGQRPDSNQHENAPVIEALKPQEQNRQRQSSYDPESSLQPAAQPEQRMHQERPKQQPPLTHSQQSATAPPRPISSSSKQRPAPSTFGTAPKPARIARPRILRNSWAPDVNDVELLRPSDFSARGAGADAAALTMIRSSAKSQPSANLRNKAEEPMPKALSTPANSTRIPTGHRSFDPRVLEAERSSRPSRATRLDDARVSRSRHDSWRPDRDGPPKASY
ncbi:Chromo domain protein Chp1p [Penicillium maclennaniae]|uniref:Chromo domain protein Chp1p n=1 Tax=Penicillium maclennaniae TaxID=1343394 RepID=UPI0025423EF8|nr:Chromo domain protein Chp1p [Penicillium maclennaniae]KAJ5670767.1 Chromo domain protein Chp1p [Penicillium maclennaniae]